MRESGDEASYAIASYATTTLGFLNCVGPLDFIYQTTRLPHTVQQVLVRVVQFNAR